MPAVQLIPAARKFWKLQLIRSLFAAALKFDTAAVYNGSDGASTRCNG